MAHTSNPRTSPCMNRPKRAAAKITDYRHYHLSGDLDTTLQGRVGTWVTQFEMATPQDDLIKELEVEKENSRKLQEELENTRLQSEIENEKLKQKQWQAAIQQLRDTKEKAQAEHE